MSELGYLNPGSSPNTMWGLSQLPQIDLNWQVQLEPNNFIWQETGEQKKNSESDDELNKMKPPPPSPDKYLVQLNYKNPIAYLPFVAFIISEVILGLVGFYLSAADKNSNWYSHKWNWTDDATYAAAVGGGVEGVLFPYSFYYSADSIGIEPTLFTAIGGAYLGGAAVNGRWDLSRWNWVAPRTINGIYEGIQNTVWLVDAIASIYSFVKDAHLGPKEEGVFECVTYLTGALISYYYIAEDNNGNYKFWEWDLKSPGVIYGIVRGFESGTRLPVGFGEVGVGLLDAVEKSMDKYDFWGAFIENFAVRNRWKIAGALWLAIVYTSEENETFDLQKWNLSSFGTLEAFLNGLVFGKGLDEMFIDVRKYLLDHSNFNNDNGKLLRLL